MDTAHEATEFDQTLLSEMDHYIEYYGASQSLVVAALAHYQDPSNRLKYNHFRDACQRYLERTA